MRDFGGLSKRDGEVEGLLECIFWLSSLNLGYGGV